MQFRLAKPQVKVTKTSFLQAKTATHLEVAAFGFAVPVANCCTTNRRQPKTALRTRCSTSQISVAPLLYGKM